MNSRRIDAAGLGIVGRPARAAATSCVSSSDTSEASSANRATHRGGCAAVTNGVALSEDYAQCERIPEAEAAHRLRRGDRVENAASFERALELMPK
jgi:hypothetical protein